MAEDLEFIDTINCYQEKSNSQLENVKTPYKNSDSSKINNKRTYTGKCNNLEFILAVEGHYDQVLLRESGQKLSEELLVIQRKIQPANDKQPTKAKQQFFSIEERVGCIKLIPNPGKPIAGKVGSPIAYSNIKKKLWREYNMRRFHSDVSGYVAQTPKGDKARPKQLLSPEMVDKFVDEKIADNGGINTMLTTFGDNILGPIEEAFRLLPEHYPKIAGEEFSSDFKNMLEVIVDAQIRTLPSGLFLMTHLYHSNHKLIALGSPTVRSKTQLTNQTKQAKKKYIPAQFGANEIKRRQKILSDIEKLIDRIARLMGGISFLGETPKFKEGQLETYWNQDLELTPGSLVFNLRPSVQKDQLQSGVAAIAPADCSSVEQAEYPTTTGSIMDLEVFHSPNDHQSLDSQGLFSPPNEKSLFGFVSYENSPKRSFSTDLKVSESLLVDQNTTGIYSGDFDSEFDVNLETSYSQAEFAFAEEH